jgi:hypothetical protein
MRKTLTIAITATILMTPPVVAHAQRPGPPRLIAYEDLPAAVDTTVVDRTLHRVAAALGRMAPGYPRLADWDTPKGDAWADAGTRRTPTSLEYGHALTTIRTQGYNGRFGPNGFHLRVTVYTQRAFVRLSAPAVGTVVWGAPVGGGCAVATVYSAHPRAPEVEAAVGAVLQDGLSARATCTTPLDEPGYVLIARWVSTATLDSTQPDIPFIRWLASDAGVDTSRVEWEMNDCGEGGDGQRAPTCVSGSAWLGGDTLALFTVIVANLEGAPWTPAIWSLQRKTGATYVEYRTLAEWVAALGG